MSSIIDFLNLISGARYGREVRQAIVDAITQCYSDGRAGVNDLKARQLIERINSVNEEQSASIDSLTARVSDLEGGSSGGSTIDTTTTDVPTLIVDTGYETFDGIGSDKTVKRAVSFSETFTEAPIVFAVVVFPTYANTYYAQVIASPIRDSITTTGFELAVGNKFYNPVSPAVMWVAFQKTTTTINTEIIVPTTDDLTQEQINNLIGLLD